MSSELSSGFTISIIRLAPKCYGLSSESLRDLLQALCINDAVLKLGSTTRINERCLELQKAKPAKKAASAGAANEKPAAKTSSCGCPYRKSKRTSLRHLKVSRGLLVAQAFAQATTVHAAFSCRAAHLRLPYISSYCGVPASIPKCCHAGITLTGQRLPDAKDQGSV